MGSDDRVAYHRVSLHHIDQKDQTYRISTARSLEPLKISIAQLGIINPPTLVALENRYQIVSGFSRIAAWHALGHRNVTARCLPPDNAGLPCVMTAIADNASQRELDVIELSRACDLLAKANVAGQDLINQLQTLGLGINASLLAKLRRVDGMSETLKDGLAEGTIALPTALRLHDMVDATDREQLCRLFRQLRLSLNRQRELFDWIHAISRRDHRSVVSLLNEEPVSGWRQDRGLDPRQRCRLIREYFKNQRFPEISAHERRFNDGVNRLNLQNRIRLTPPPYFEGRTYCMQLEFENPQELNHHIGELQRIIEFPAFKQLIEKEEK
ncbi:MAG: ParB N-terminal domain-containing protein [Desulfatitalea sp.]|nr:ParB/RepB/Spo0J family partition protein [Desulfatitalea sp.]NNK00010.1 ParB N-terminal domain-containing protein [Desulfatitalea sp.]